MILLEGFDTHVGNNARVWKGVIGKHDDADVNDNGKLLLQLQQCTVYHEQFLPIQRFAQVHLVQRLIRSMVINWFLHIFSWRVPISVGCSCRKMCRTCRPITTWWSELTSWKISKVYTSGSRPFLIHSSLC